jgi:hypothetical protein
VVAACADELTSPQVVESMQSFKDRFESQSEWVIEYTHDREYHVLPPGYEPNMTSTTVTNAMKRGWRYLHHQINRTNKAPSGTWTLWKDDVCIDRVSGTYQIQPDMNPKLVDRMFYTNTLFLNIHSKDTFNTGFLTKLFAGDSPNAAFTIGLPECVEKDPSAYSVRSQRETIAGVSCVVLEKPNVDVIWLDTEHGGVCRQRLLYYPSGQMAAMHKNENLREAVPGLWLPQYQEVIRYNGDGTPDEMHGKIRYIERNNIIKIKFDDVADDLFDVPVPKQGVVIDHIRGMTYTIHEDDADPASVFSKAAEQSLAESGSGLSQYANRTILIGINLCVVAAILLLIQIRRARSR